MKKIKILWMQNNNEQNLFIFSIIVEILHSKLKIAQVQLDNRVWIGGILGQKSHRNSSMSIMNYKLAKFISLPIVICCAKFRGWGTKLFVTEVSTANVWRIIVALAGRINCLNTILHNTLNQFNYGEDAGWKLN